MGFTIEDMMLTSTKRYQMEFVAGKDGWSNSISWVHLLEDTTIISHFWGKELAVTTGLGFPTTEKLLRLLEHLVHHHAAGLIVNVGKYIMELPQEVIDYCNENDLPLLTVPWEIFLGDMIKDFSIRIFLQGRADEQITNALIAAIETPSNQEAYRKDLLPYFDVDGNFQIVLITSNGLDSMDTVERRKLSYRLQVYLEQITHNGSFFYYNSYFILVTNAVPEDFVSQVTEGMIKRAKRRMSDTPIYVGIGSSVVDISNMYISYKRARAAVTKAQKDRCAMIKFDDMGLYRLLYMEEDERLLQQIEEEKLSILDSYDKKHHSNYIETLKYYLELDGSIQAIAKAMFTHRNTVNYRVTNIKKLLGCQLATPEERLPYQIALHIRSMHEEQEHE